MVSAQLTASGAYRSWEGTSAARLLGLPVHKETSLQLSGESALPCPQSNVGVGCDGSKGALFLSTARVQSETLPQLLKTINSD